MQRTKWLVAALAVLAGGVGVSLAALATSEQELVAGTYTRSGIQRALQDRNILSDSIMVRVEADAAADERLAIAVQQLGGTVEVLTEADDAVPGFRKVQLHGADVFEALRSLEAVDGVASASPNIVYRADGIPSDPQFARQWNMHNTGQSPPGGLPDADIDAAEAWDITTGAGTTVVAVVDSGVQLDHGEFTGRIWSNPIEAPGGVCAFNGLDDDGNGLIDDCNGYDFVSSFIGSGTNGPRDNDPSPCGSSLAIPDTLDCGGHLGGEGFVSHGTHVAGIIAAAQNNSVGGYGISGVAPSVTIMPVRALTEGGEGTTGDVIDAMNYAIGEGADVVNMSFGSDVYDAAFDAVVAAAITNDVVLVAAAGNASENVVSGFECDSPICNDDPGLTGANSVLAVASTNEYDRKSGFSNYSTQNYVDVAAPGSSILSTCYDTGALGMFACGTSVAADVGVDPNEYANMSGTSQATPHAAGVAALLRSAFPGLTAPQIVNGVMFSGDNVTAQNAGLAGCPSTNGSMDCTTGLNGSIGKTRLSAFGAFGPHLVGVSPATGTRGTALTVTITGVNTSWWPGSVVDFGEGIGVSNLSCASQTSCSLTLNITNAAPLGKHSVTVTTDAEVVSLTDVFTVNNSILRIAGANRIETAIETSKIAYSSPGSADTVLLARSDAFPDSLAGTPLASFTDGVILFTSTKSLDPATSEEIVRVLAHDNDAEPDIYLLGGQLALSPAVEAAAQALDSGWQVKRVGGANRSETSLRVAEELHGLRGTPPTNVVIATQTNFPDALAAAVPAADAAVDEGRMPVLLTSATSLSKPVADYLAVFGSGVQYAYIIGGTSAVSDKVLLDVDALVGQTIRLAGPDRYSTAVAVADQFYQTPVSASYASGKNFPDALAGSYLSAMRRSPMLLVNGGTTPQSTIDYTVAHAKTLLGGFMFGGTAVIPDSVRELLEGII